MINSKKLSNEEAENYIDLLHEAITSSLKGLDEQDVLALVTTWLIDNIGPYCTSQEMADRIAMQMAKSVMISYNHCLTGFEKCQE